MAPSTRKGDRGQPQYRDSKGDWHDSPRGPSGEESRTAAYGKGYDSEPSGDSGGGGDSGGAASRSISTPTGNSRTVAGLMGMAIIFSVIGAEINPKAADAGKAFSEPFVIIGGGTIAAVILSLLADTGNTGRQFAVGLAGLACVTAVLVNGGPVWKAIDSFLGAKAPGSTSTTKPTSGAVTNPPTAASGNTGSTAKTGSTGQNKTTNAT
jgi:hypothetical protein